MRLPHTAVFLVASMVGWAVNATEGGVVEFFEKSAWLEAVGPFQTIPFTGLPDGTFITDQYADLGILFTDGDDTIHMSPSYMNDGWGLRGNGIISVSFDTAQAWIGVDFPGLLRIELFSAGELIYTSDISASSFLGLISSEFFDGAVLSDPLDGLAFIDDLHFGVPAPGALFLFALAGLGLTGRRRA